MVAGEERRILESNTSRDNAARMWRQARNIGVTALVVVAVSAYLLYSGLRAPGGFGPEAMFWGFGLLVGCMLALGAVYMLVFAWKAQASIDQFGEVNAVLEPPWPVIGGGIKGSIDLPAKVAGAKEIEALLCCTEYFEAPSPTYAGGTDPGIPATGSAVTMPAQNLKWKEVRRFPVNAGVAAFEFDVPANQRPSVQQGSSGSVWELTVKASSGGLEFSRVFIVNVLPSAPQA